MSTVDPAPTVSPVLSLRGISKRFPGVQALQDVSIDFYAGTCHALIGENGAGKSTLGKLISGIHSANSGEVLVRGEPVHFSGPLDAQKAGIGIVHQELLFCENMTVAENLCLSHFPERFGLVDKWAMSRKARDWMALINVHIDPNTLVGALPIAQQQLVQIAGALGSGAQILIFDEPTSSLGKTETERLLQLIKELKASGVLCIYVSHRMEEIFEVCDTASVLRDGKLVGTEFIANLTRDRLVSMMIGRKLEASLARTAPSGQAGPPVLEVSRLSSPGKFADISFAVAPGEILGLGGLVGAGRTEVVEALFGLDPHSSGAAALKGSPLLLRSPHKSVDMGLGLVPEDRKRHGLVIMQSCKANISLPVLDRLRIGFLINAIAERGLSLKFFQKMRVKAPSVDTIVATLSGGNQQKVVIAKWLGANCDVLLIDEPTRGVDVGAKAEIHDLIRSLAAEGKGVVVVSSELPELMSLSHRILVLRNGRLVGEQPAEEASEESLMRLMTGVHAT